MKNTILKDRINKLMHDLDINQKDLCERTGICRSTLSRYIAGARNPKSSTLKNIANALNTTPDYLTGRIDIASLDKYNTVYDIINDNIHSWSLEQRLVLINMLSKNVIEGEILNGKQ